MALTPDVHPSEHPEKYAVAQLIKTDDNPED
jgi:hypothetical protein